MEFLATLDRALSEFHLLKHDFYKKWNEGHLGIEALQHYAMQYYQNVEAFPRYVSGVHSHCASLRDRQILLENLIDEERGDNNHPALWLKFAESLGLDRAAVLNAEADPATRSLVDGLLALTKTSYASGLGALFAYEQQVPAVAESKISGLKKFYGFDDSNQGLDFFKVHIHADEWHAKECADLLEKLSDQEKDVAQDAAVKAAKLLWQFLDFQLVKMEGSAFPS